jgi:ATP/maltotriose-dependent transcriptional regulator MalT
MHAEELRLAIEDGDVEKARRIMAQLAPHLPQPKTDFQAAATLHHARTQITAMPFNKRAYSHAWLTERGLPSGLPDHLRPKAERMYPIVVEAVGVAVRTPPHRRALGKAIERAMSDAALECYANNETDPEFIRARMQEARFKIRRGD